MVKTFMPRNRLADAVSAEGIGRNEAAAGAHANLEHLRADSMAELDRTLEQMAALAPAITSLDDDRIDDLYAGANRVVAIAGVFALHDLSGYAYELCEAISRMQDAGAWKQAVVIGFVDSLKEARTD
jgi:hypothetical protein